MSETETNLPTSQKPQETKINLKEHLTEIAEDPELQQQTFTMIETLDRTNFMETVRKVWNNIPSSFQNIILKVPSILPHIKLLKGFVRMGLLQPKDPMLAIEDISKTEAILEKIAFWVAKKLVPEMVVFEETVDPYLKKLGFEGGLDGYLKLQGGLTEDFCTRMRTRLYVSRLQKNVKAGNDNKDNGENNRNPWGARQESVSLKGVNDNNQTAA